MRVLRGVLRFVGAALVLVVLGLASGCQQQAVDPSATEAMTALADRVRTIWNEGDLELIDDLVAPGFGERRCKSKHQRNVRMLGWKLWCRDPIEYSQDIQLPRRIYRGGVG